MKKRNKLSLFLYLLCALSIKAQIVGTTSTNPIVVTAGTTSLTNQSPDANQKWYKLTLGKPNFALNAKTTINNNTYALRWAQVLVYDNTNTLIYNQQDSIRPDSSLLFNIENIPSGASTYVNFNFDASCSTCTASTASFKFNINEYILSTCSATTPAGCEFVYNNSFENFTIPCNSLGFQQALTAYPACSWSIPSFCSASSPTVGTPDFINTCFINPYTYFYGGQDFLYSTTPNTGSAYAGIFLYSSAQSNYREYLQQQLSSPLISGQVYVLQMYVKANYMSGYLTNNLYVYLDNSFPCQSGITCINSSTLTGQLLQVTPAVITNTANWQLCTVTFTASGNYSKLMIGNFKNDAITAPTLVTNLGGSWSWSYCFIDDVSLKPNLNYTVSTSSQTICSSASSTITINSTANNTYNWQPGSLSGTLNVVSPTVTSNYTITATNTLGCISTTIIPITVFSNTLIVNATASPTNVCPSGNVTLNSTSNGVGTNYTWYSPTIVGTGSNVSVNPISSTVYTVTGTSTSGCISQSTVAINVYPNNPSFTYTVSNPFVCLPSNSSTVSVTNSVTSTFTITAAGSPTAASTSIILTPTVTTIYTITANNSYGCVTSQTFQIGVVDCACLTQAYNLTPPYLANYVPIFLPAYLPYNVTNNVYHGASVTFSNAEVRVFPNVEWRVAPTGTLNIIGSHFYACGDMWKGIVVEPGGVLNIISSNTATPFIEDAYVAIECVTFTSGTVPASIINAQNVTFNRNQIGIRISDFKPNQTTYPFTIQNCLFTSRSIPYSNLTWPATSTIKNGASGNSSALQTPYINGTSYPLANLKSPLATLTPSTGIVIKNVGYTNNLGNQFKSIVIGNAANTASFNCFDNLREDITATNSNFLLANNVFQNGVRYGRGSNSGGKAVVAVSTNINCDALGAINNSAILQSTGTSTNMGNYFYDKTAAVTLNGYINTLIENSAAYSFSNYYGAFSLLNPLGASGFNVTTNRFVAIIMQKNRLYNIANAMTVNMDNNCWNASGFSGYGKIVGRLDINNNTVARHPGTATGTEAVNNAFVLNDPFASASYSLFAGTGVGNSVYSNNFNNVLNGVSVNNINFSGVSIYSNTISMLNEPNTIFGAPVQNGIVANQIGAVCNIYQNTLSGPASYTNVISGLKTSLNSSLAVNCNSVTNTYHGLNFNANQALTTVQDNVLQGQKYGISLTSTATIGQQGNATTPTNNQWLGTWAGQNKKTMNENQYSSAQNSKIYVTWGGALDPNGSSTVIASPGLMNKDDYFHAPSNPLNTLLSASSVPASCRITGGGGGGGAMASLSVGTSTGLTAPQQSVMENLVSSSGQLQNVDAANKFVNQFAVYKSIAANNSYTAGSAALTGFYNSNPSMQSLVNIERLLTTGQFTAAQSQINALSNSNAVLTNYKSYYNLYIKYKSNTLLSADSVNLVSIANLCPYTNGAVVYQARALNNMVKNAVGMYSDNCGTASSSRLINSVVNGDDAETKTINVILKSILYPNPNSGEFGIKLQSTAAQGKIDLEVYDISGKLVYKNNTVANDNQITIKTNLVKGVYLLKVVLGDGSADIHRLIID